MRSNTFPFLLTSTAVAGNVCPTSQLDEGRERTASVSAGGVGMLSAIFIDYLSAEISITYLPIF